MKLDRIVEALVAGAVCAMVFVVPGCFFDSQTIIVGQTQGNPNSPSGVGTGSGGACENAATLTPGTDAGVLKPGEQSRLFLTARTASGQEIKPPCSDSKSPTWSDFTPPANCEFSGGRTGFVVFFRAVATVGVCETTVSLDGKTSEPIRVRIEP